MAVSAYDAVLAAHVLGVVVAFGVTFAYPLMFAIAAKRDPRGLPLLHRIERTLDQVLVNGGLTVVVAAGIFLAADGHHWKEFFVQWGIGAAIVIGGLVGAVMIPTSRRAQQTAERDLAASPEGEEPAMSDEYRKLTLRLAVAGGSASLLVLLTIVFMVIKP